SGEVHSEANKEVNRIITLMKDSKEKLEDPETYFNLKPNERRDEMYEFGHDSYYLCFNWLNGFYEIKDKKLVATIYEKLGHYGINESERRFKQTEYRFDRNLNGENVWTSGKKSFSSAELVQEWISNFLETLSQREKNCS
ncbi:MAG: hypothetical protein JWQ96_892, partial [Segetibacter sp.]|nr:hypothetical protein [Segetibacter sp.]